MLRTNATEEWKTELKKWKYIIFSLKQNDKNFQILKIDWQS